MTKLYGEISKVETQDDGTLKVWGYASSETVDSDGEVITSEAMKAAIPDYMKFGAVREMHGQNAAGTAIEIKVEEDGRTYFGAHVVDPIAVKKVQTGVYKGFSIGGSVTARDELNKSVIKGVKLTEISLVDRPANPEAVFTCFKADKGEAEENEQFAENQDGKETPSEKEKSEAGKEKDKPKDDDKAEKAALNADEIEALRKMLASSSTDAPQDELVAKSLWGVKSLADVLQSVQWFINDCSFDGDISPDVVSKAKTAAQSLAEALVTLTEAEAGKIHEDFTGKANKPDDLQKAFHAKENELQKMQAERDSALAELAELKKQAAAPKGHLKVVSKAEDNGGDDVLKGFTPITDDDGSLNEAATLVKAAQSGRL